VCYPKRTDKPLYHGLVKQLQSLGSPFLQAEELPKGSLEGRFDLVLDSIFGFSFKGPPRAPFDTLLTLMRPSAHPPTLVAVDSPSG
jgi:NAD(P)H-hydrate repair Nnr-like enzyme with NAD(P)H-hydrate epimerase domain